MMMLFSKAQLSRFERTDGKETATYAEAIQWYKDLDKISAEILVKEMGPTDAGVPLHLVMISKDRTFDPIKWHKDKKVLILIINGIHAGEPDGIDASMLLVRDLSKKKVVLPENVTLAFIPVYNIGGCLNRNSYTRANQNGPVEYGFRGNSQNLDLNRDFTKSDSREARSFAQIFHFLNPDILIDNHVSDGADYQHTMTLISTQYDKLGPTLGKWMKEKFDPTLYKGMTAKGWDMIPYVNFETINVGNGMEMFSDPPRYSSGYAALFNTLAYVPETHMLKPFKERVMSIYDLMKTFIESASSNARNLIMQRANANKEVVAQKVFPLYWNLDSARYDEITFKGYEVKHTNSEATGLQKMYYDHQTPYMKKIKYYNTYNSTITIEKPTAYIIPQGWHKVLELLKLNKVRTSLLEKDTIINVSVYRIDDYKTLASPYEGHHKNHSVKVSVTTQQIKFLKGDYIIYLNQSANRYIVEMLEPTGDDSFFAWNFFDPILQQKEGYSNYRWEDVASEVLRKNPKLKQKLEAKKESDSKFAKDASAQLDFIYKNSPYYEPVHLRYPVYRLVN